MWLQPPFSHGKFRIMCISTALIPSVQQQKHLCVQLHYVLISFFDPRSNQLKIFKILFKNFVTPLAPNSQSLIFFWCLTPMSAPGNNSLQAGFLVESRQKGGELEWSTSGKRWLRKSDVFTCCRVIPCDQTPLAFTVGKETVKWSLELTLTEMQVTLGIKPVSSINLFQIKA